MTRRLAVAAALDVAAVVSFVALGRGSHHEPGSWPAATVRVAAPFLIALGVGWVVLRAWREPRAITTGIGLWPVTVALGMLLRRTVFDRGTALAFVIVATIVLGAFLVGWRLAASRLARSALFVRG